jgi:hypothetical protein
MWEQLWILSWQYQSEWFIHYHTNPSHEVPLSFVWLKFSSFGWDVDMRRIRSGKTLSLGIPKAPQGNIQGRSKQLTFWGIPSFVFNIIGNLTWSYIFLRHMICVLLGASFYFIRICLMLFRIIFCIFYCNKSVKFSLSMLILQVYMLLFWKQKVFYRCLNSSGKSECGKILKVFHNKVQQIFYSVVIFKNFWN